MALRAGFIGLGNIGKPMASHLVPAGFETTLFDIAEEPLRELVAAGAVAAASPREVGERCDVIGICVPNDEPSSENIIVDGELGNGARLKLAINALSYIQWAAAYEAFTLAKASGLDPEVFEAAGRANGQLTDLQARFLTSHKLPEEAVANEGLQNYLKGAHLPRQRPRSAGMKP